MLRTPPAWWPTIRGCCCTPPINHPHSRSSRDWGWAVIHRSPKASSQAGRILALLLSAHFCSDPLHCANENCGRVPLPRILALHISQYSSRVWDLRHRYGYLIENGPEQDNADHTWFRLAGHRKPDALKAKATRAELRAELEAGKSMPDGISPTPVLPTPAFPQFGELARESYGVD